MNTFSNVNKTRRPDKREADMRRNFTAANPNMEDMKQAGDRNLANHCQSTYQNLNAHVYNWPF